MSEKPSLVKQYAAYTGKTVGTYYLEQLLEQAETGPIFLARSIHPQTQGRYRLRLLALPAGLSPEDRLLFLGYFQREATQVAELQHNALLPLNDFGIFEGVPYLVSPELSFVSFQSKVTKSGGMDTRQVGYYLDRLATGLEYMHQQGVFHLNLNVRNIVLSQDGQALITEAGLLRMLSPQVRQKNVPGAEQSRELENGFPLLRDRQGRPLYGLNLASAPAPELLLGQPPDASTDVYALGAILYYLLTGHRVMRGKTLAEIADHHLNAAVPSLRSWRQDVPEELDRLLGSALAKHRTARLRYPGALAQAYAEVIAPGQGGRTSFVAPGPLPASSLPFSAPALPQAPSLPWAARRRTIALLATGGLVVAGGALWVLSQRGNAHPGTTSAISTQSAPVPTTNSSGSAPQGTVLAKTADLPVNGAKTFPIANSNNPGVLIHLPDNHFVAFNSTCTHAGCAVAYNQQNHLLVCPCHGATFDPARNAAVVNGPASSPLTPVAITVNKDGTVTTNG